MTRCWSRRTDEQRLERPKETARAIKTVSGDSQVTLGWYQPDIGMLA